MDIRQVFVEEAENMLRKIRPRETKKEEVVLCSDVLPLSVADMLKLCEKEGVDPEEVSVGYEETAVFSNGIHLYYFKDAPITKKE